MPNSEKLSVLLVEDHDVQRRTMARILKSFDANVIEVENGRPAIQVINSGQRIDLVICDIDMPDMDGLAFLRNIGSTGNKTSVVICSAKDTAVLNAAYMMAKEYGVRLLGMIEKPFSRESFEKILVEQFRQFTPRSRGKPVDDLSFTLDQILEGLHKEQFVPFFQPKLNLKTNKVAGVEALARWIHPQYGVVSPYAFITVLEQKGAIEGLTFNMLAKVSETLNRWRALGIHLKVSLNLSVTSLSDVTLADRVTDCVKSAGLDAHDFVLEVTETAAMGHVAPVLENLARLRMKGFGLSIDDYGTGYSSLRQLSRIPFTELKIDRSFVADCEISGPMATIVECSIELAHQLSLQCVAEGVETRGTLDKLKTLGCDLAQGYFIAKPMDESACLEFLSHAGARH